MLGKQDVSCQKCVESQHTHTICNAVLCRFTWCIPPLDGKDLNELDRVWRKDESIGFHLFYNSYGMNLKALRPRASKKYTLLSLLSEKSLQEAFDKV